MKKAVILLPAFVLALSATAFAQAVDKGKDRPETVKINISGTWDLEFVFRSVALSQWTAGIGLPAVVDTRSSTEFIPTTWVVMDVELTDKVSAKMELGLSSKYNIGNDGINPEFGQLYAQLTDMFMEGLTLKAGQVWFDFDIRGKHSSIVLDSFWSEGFSTSQSPDARSAHDYSYSAGAVLTYAREAIQVDVFLLPKNNDLADPSTAKTDEAIYGFDFFYKLDSIGKGSRIGALFDAVSDAAGSGATFTFGIAADLFFMSEALEAFAEVYFQFGENGLDFSVSGTGNAKASGMAFQLGARYSFTSDMKPWVELKVTWLSGDDGLVADGDAQKNWQAKEHQADLMILESEVYGVDWDTNYFAIKVLGGLGFMNEGGSNKLWLNMAIGFAQTQEDVGPSAGLVPPPPVGTTESSLGIEVDLKVSYNYSKAVNLETGLAANFGNDVMEIQTLEQTNSSFLFWVGANARW